jgi:hypothetical protein
MQYYYIQSYNSIGGRYAILGVGLSAGATALKAASAGVEFIEENGAKGDSAAPEEVAQSATREVAAGLEFIDENGGGPGVRLRMPPKQKR